MSDSRPIGIFDSGVGGLSILSSVQKLLPTESFIYLADQANIPYGDKTTEQLQEIVTKVLDFLVSRNVKLIIVACNTATVHTIDFLRSKYNIPIVGTVPVVKTIVNNTKTGKTAVFATPATANSKYLQDLIKEYGNGVKVDIIGDTQLEHIVENGDLTNPKINTIIENIFRPLVEKSVDSVALGCTHYPFLKEKMEEIVDEKIKIYDSGEAIARQTKKVLQAENMFSDKKSNDEFYTTGDVNKFVKVAHELHMPISAKSIKI